MAEIGNCDREVAGDPETSQPRSSQGGQTRRSMGTQIKRFLKLPFWGNRGSLTIATILGWADAHHAATGRWPTRRSGPIRQAAFSESWAAISQALKKGHRSLPGGQTLAQLLQEHRGLEPRLSAEGALRSARVFQRLRAERLKCNGRVTLSVERILGWADAHRAATGRWPSVNSGRIRGVPGETWNTINTALVRGRGGLQGGMKLCRLLEKHRGKKIPRVNPPDLTVEKVLAWADAYHAANGQWPLIECGPVSEAPENSWRSIDQALRRGQRGLPRGSSLPRLLLERRGVRCRSGLPRLRIEQILAWADAHRAAAGKWPTRFSGEVREAPGERWCAIDGALFKGNRGLSGGSSLALLLHEHRPVRKRLLTLETILAWAETHRQAHGVWPAGSSGPVDGMPEENWKAIDADLYHGRRGLPGGTTLAKLLGRAINPAAKGARPKLTVDQILAWAEAHHAANGRWPTVNSGSISSSPGEKWVNIDVALREGRRGLASGSSLAKLFAGRPDHPIPKRDRPRLSLDQILAWCDEHYATTGRWPAADSGPIPGAAGERWVSINMALSQGRRGLPSGLSLAKLFAGRPTPPSPRKPRN